MKFVYDPPLDPHLSIIYQDDDLVVVDKPSGLLSVRGKAPEHQDSLQARLEDKFDYVGIVHRLDMSTSGLMVVALNKPALSHLNRQFQDRKTKKTYRAQVFGVLPKASGEVNLPLITDWPNRPKQKVCHDSGKPSQSKWQVIKQHDDYAEIHLTPITVRSHQLRVHMAELGHPILGDKFYAHSEAFNMRTRLQLHAEYLGFEQPSTGQWLDFKLAAPFN